MTPTPAPTTSAAPSAVDGRARTPGWDAPVLDGDRRIRVPQLAVGLLLVAGAALGFVLFNGAATQRAAVLTLAGDVARGDVLTLENLRIAYVGHDGDVTVTPADQADSLVGRVAVADLGAGTLAVAGQFTSGATLTVGGGVVGLALSPGQYPSPALGVGDLVNVLDVTAGQRVVVEAAQVVAVAEVGTQGQRFVSLLTGEELAGEVAAAAAAGEVRLVMVARESGVS